MNLPCVKKQDVVNVLLAGSKESRLPTLTLFRMGWDTAQIAAAKGKTEAQVYNWLSTAREQERRQIAEARSAK